MLLSGLTVAVILILVLMGSLVLPFLLGVRGGTSTPILNATTVSRLVKKWAFQTGNNVESSPTVDNGIVYVGSRDQNLYAFALPEASP